MLDYIEYTVIAIDEEIIELAQKIVDKGILKQKSFDDCQHISAAVIYNCDCIISWNFKHIVNIKTIRGVRAITNIEGYKNIDIVNPLVLLEKVEYYNGLGKNAEAEINKRRNKS